MDTRQAYKLYREFILGKHIDHEASRRFLMNLSSSQISEMPKICYDFAQRRNLGDDLIFSLGLIYRYVTMCDATAFLVFFKKNDLVTNYAMAYDARGYLKFNFAEQSIRAGYTGSFIGSSQGAAFDIAGLTKGQPFYLLDPYGKLGLKRFSMEEEFYDKQLPR